MTRALHRYSGGSGFNLLVKVLQDQINGLKSLHTGVPVCVVAKNLKGKTVSSQKWLQRQLNDHYAAQARKLGYRARSAFKLIEMDEKFVLLKPGMKILDCGAAPGAWSQVCAKKINCVNSDRRNKPVGTLVSVDLLDFEPIPGVMILPNSDFTDAATQAKIMSRFTRGEREEIEDTTEQSQSQEDPGRPVKLDGVISDMAPNATGHHETDHFRIVKLLDAVLEFAREHGAPDSFLIAKLWQGSEVNRVLQRLKGHYKAVRMFKPESSRAESSEIFVLGRGKKS